MSHTTTIGKTIFIHNGGYEGAVQINRGDGSVTVPFSDLKDFVAEYLREELISQIECLPTNAILEIALGGTRDKLDSNK